MDPDLLIEFLRRHPGVQFSPSGSLRVPLQGNASAALPQALTVLQELQASPIPPDP